MAELLSIIIVAYKSRDEIGACLNSIPKGIEWLSIEVFVVDNFGADEIENLISEHFPHVHYLRPDENLGFGRANNLGFRHSHGDFILFLNPDTVCDSRALLHCAQRLKTERVIGLISPRLKLLDGSIDLACRRSIPTLWDGFCRASGLARRFPHLRCFAAYNLTYLPETGAYEVGAINGAFMMGRRSAFEDVGVFDESFFMYGDDLDLCIRFARAGYRICYDGSVETTHIKGVSVAKDYDKMSAAIFDANRSVYLKHFNPNHSRWIWLKYTAAFGLWKLIALTRARLQHRRVVKPL